MYTVAPQENGVLTLTYSFVLKLHFSRVTPEIFVARMSNTNPVQIC